MSTSVFGAAPLPTYAPGRRNVSVRHDRNLDLTPGRFDMRFSGMFLVQGTTAVAGQPDVPVSRLTLLFDKTTKLPVRTKMSNADGTYRFDCVRYGPWSVIAFDHTGEYNAVIADNIYGEPM